jgi:hypothetical protein
MNQALVGLATARLTAVVVEDEVMAPVRNAIQRWGADAELYSVRERLTTLSGCTRCVSVYAAAAVVAASRVRVLRPVVAALAASEAAILLYATIERLDR